MGKDEGLIIKNYLLYRKVKKKTQSHDLFLNVLDNIQESKLFFKFVHRKILILIKFSNIRRYS